VRVAVDTGHMPRWVDRRQGCANGWGGRAFTLIELLVVIAVMGILAAIVIRVANLAQQKAAVSNARADLARIELGLENYRAEYGRYPRVDGIEELLDELYFEPIDQGEPVFIELEADDLTGDIWEDPWGNPYEYRGVDPVNNPDSYDLWSSGMSLTNGMDDITNW